VTHPLRLTRLAQLPLRQEFGEQLAELLRPQVEQLRQHMPIAAMFATLSVVLPGPEPIVTSYRDSWTLMYATIGRLDSLQDGDPLQALPQVETVGEHYNLVFASYVLAASLLDDLAMRVPDGRLSRLQRLWNDCMLRMADGQQQDLASGAAPLAFETLGIYQQIAQAKTGATYALAFGGVATLLADDHRLVDALTQVGEIYGTLVQYADDLRDAASQPNAALTLPALLPFIPHGRDLIPSQIASAFWSYVYTRYREAALDLLASYPNVRDAVAVLFTDVFGPDAS
jgi:hypothetical protein